MAEVTIKVPSVVTKIINYLKYPSTWKGIIAGLTIIGVNLQPDLQAQIITAGTGVVSAIAIFFSDADVTPPSA